MNKTAKATPEKTAALASLAAGPRPGPERPGTMAAAGAESVTTRLIEGADHVYTGREKEAARIIAAWLNELR